MTTVSDFQISAELASDLRGVRGKALIVGAIGVVALVAGFLTAGEQFFRSYLFAYMYYIGLGMGCLAVLMLQYLTGGSWGIMVRRVCEAATRTFPVLLLLFLPIAFGIPKLYKWSDPAFMKTTGQLMQRAKYLNVPFFLGRAAFYFAGFLLLSYLLNKWSAKQDREGGEMMPAQRISGPGLIFYGIAVTFMAIDWTMSLNPAWFSTIYGLLLLAGQGLSTFAFLITVLTLLSRRKPLSEALTSRHMHDLGKLMFAFTMLWAYFSFSQFLVIWSGNLPEEIPWYITRMQGGWGVVAMLLLLFHFALPFCLLLSRDIKRNYKMIRNIALLVMIMRFVDLFWWVMPEFHKAGFAIHWLDIVTPIALGGIWVYFFIGELLKRPLLPVGDPGLQGALEHGGH